jgi:hypothetical protein
VRRLGESGWIHQANSGADSGIAGAILTSGFYELGAKVPAWKDYYGEDRSLAAPVLDFIRSP